MRVAGTVAVVTGGASGIGAALAGALVGAGARVVVADLNGADAEAVARGIGPDAVGAQADVTSEDDLRSLLALAEERFGPVDIFCANAGIMGASGLGDEQAWETTVDVNVLAHVRAARLLVPQWIERGGGHFVSTASAAGLLTQVGYAAYSTAKHAAVGFSEWLAVTYGDKNIRVSCLCPMAVETGMLEQALENQDQMGRDGARVTAAAGAVLDPAQVAEVTVAAIEEDRFLITPHPEVAGFHAAKATDHERWIASMRRLQAKDLPPPEAAR